MKNIKRLALVAMLIGSVAVLSSCAFKMNTEQKEYYEGFISLLETQAKVGDIPAIAVTAAVKVANEGANALDFKIVDNKDGSPIAKNTGAAELRKRFIPKKK